MSQRKRRSRSTRRRQLSIEQLEKRQVLVGSLDLVHDAVSTPRSSDPSSMLTIGSLTYFAATTEENGRELWRTDGTLGGTFRLTEAISAPSQGAANAGSLASSDPSGFVERNGALFFTAATATGARRLWQSDGTVNGTRMVTGSVTTPSLGSDSLLNINGTLYFTGNDGLGFELFRTNGTEQGTSRVRDINPSILSSNPTLFRQFDNRLVFVATDSTNGTELWISDGTELGTTRISQVVSGNGSSFISTASVLGNSIVFGTNVGLWRTDGTLTSTQLVSNAITNASESETLNGAVLLSTFSGLWRSDGTTTGTLRITDPAVSTVNSLSIANGQAFFFASTSANGSELWRSDGTAGGTSIVVDLNAGNASGVDGAARWIRRFGDHVYFRGNNGTSGFELWRSDGTAQGTQVVRDIVVGTGSSNPSSLTVRSDGLVFAANDGTTGVELWMSNGTGSGTQRIRDIDPGTQSSNPRIIGEINQRILFTTNFDTVSRSSQLWSTNGTSSGTTLVGSIFNSGTPLVRAGGTHFFVASGGNSRYELWKTDGTASGTVLVRELVTGASGSYPSDLVEMNGLLYFAASTNSQGRELWRSDGTSAGTTIVSDIVTGSTGSNPSSLVNFNGTLLFSANGGQGYELWRSNGTSLGTTLVRDINGGSADSNPARFTEMNGTMYFVANDANGFELWRTDGTAGGTVRVRDIVPGPGSSAPSNMRNVNGTLYFSAGIAGQFSDQELWKSDGTEAGTLLVRNIHTASASSYPNNFTSSAGTIFFTARDGRGHELWRTDGSESGTTIVRDLNLNGNAFPESLRNYNNTLLFVARDSTNTPRVGYSNGTLSGTDFYQGFMGVASTDWVLNNRNYFTAWREDVGWELFSLSISTNAPPNDILLSANSVAENLPAGTTVGTFSTTDPDAGNTHTYTFVDTAAFPGNAQFTIAGNQLRTAASFNFEGTDPYTIRVRTTDNGNLSFDKTFVINVTDVPESPALSITNVASPLAENINTTSSILVANITLTDPDGGANALSLSGADAASFEIISGNQLHLRSGIALDFETKPSYVVIVQSDDTTIPGSPDAAVTYTLSIGNVNERPTNITLAPSSIAENAGPAAVVGTLATVDPDGDTSFTYTLISGTGSNDNAAFTIVGTQLRAESSFNFEFKNSYLIRVESRDAGNLAFEKELTITVSNVNEPPTDLSLSAQSIDENRPAGTLVGTLSTTEPDAGNTHTYTFVDTATFPGNAQFTIAGNELRTAASFNFEGTNSYTIRVRSTDNTNLSFEKTFIITVTDVNEVPTLTISNVASPLAENSNTANSILVANIALTDPDGGANALSLTGADAASFQIVSGNQLHLRSGIGLDFETKPSLVVTVQSDDTTIPGTPDATATFTLAISNVNEAPTNVTLSRSSIPENAAVNALVGTLTSSDPDGDTSFIYSLVPVPGSTDHTAFTIDGVRLLANSSFNFEEKNSYLIRVESKDPGNLTFTKELTITVSNVNEVPTDIALSVQSIAENNQSGATVGTFTTTDPDANDTHRYITIDTPLFPDNVFFIPVGNQLRANAVFNFEERSSYTILVRAIDDGNLSFEKIFVITVTNVNEAPTLTVTNVASPLPENTNTSNSTLLANIALSDPDGGTNTLSLDGTDANAFEIVDGTQLRLRAGVPLDFETKPMIIVRVQSDDTTIPGSPDVSVIYTLNISNVNEAPTNITLSPASIPENAANNAVVGSFTTSDPDVGDTFTYNLVSGAGSSDNAAFNIVGSQLVANSSFNFEDKTSYSIRVQSRDAGNLTFEKELTVTVVNVNETPTDIALSAQSIAENRPVGTALGTFSTSDPDTGNAFTYSLVSGDGASGNGQFTIVGNELRTNASFNFEDQQSHQIRVRSTDNGNLSFEKSFVITVTDANDPPTITVTNIASPLREDANTSSSILVANIAMADQDGGTNTLSLTGSGAAAFELVSGTELRLKAGVLLNFELIPAYVVTIQADDTTIPGNPDVTTDYTLSIANVNEAPTGVQLSNNSILENLLPGTLIGNLSAIDPDAGDTATFLLVMDALDNNSFRVQGSQLLSTVEFDAEAKREYKIRVRATDSSGLSVERDLDVLIEGVNEFPPVFTSGPNYRLPENTSLVGNLVATDADVPSATLAFAIIGGADAARFNLNGNQLRMMPSANFESPSSAAGTNVFHINVRVSDGQRTDERSLTITIDDANDLPSLMTLTNNLIQENRPIATVVGAFNASDEDGDPLTFSLRFGDGNADNGRFEIVGNQLLSRQVFDFENSAHRSMSIRVGVFDGRGGVREQTFTISTQDINEPPQAFDSSWQLINGTRIQAFSIPASDPESQPLAYEITQPPRFGSLTGTGRERTYVANNGFFGTDELYFKVSDGVSWSSEKRLQFQMIATPPTVNFTTAAASWNESSGMFSIPVTLSPPAQVDFDLIYTLGGTATVFSDYEWPRLLITAGSSVAHIPVFLTNDATFEGQTPETLILTLGHASVGTPGFNAGTSNQFTLSIVDDETIPTVSFVESTVARAELTTYEIKVLLSGPSIQDVVIPLVLSGSASSNDYTLDTTQITIPAGSRTGSTWIRVVDDTIPEHAENVIIAFGQLQNAVVASNTGSNPRMTLTIPANDRPTVSISSDRSTSEDSWLPVRFTATLSEQLTHELRVPFSVSGTLNSPADYRIIENISDSDWQLPGVPATEFVFPPLQTHATIAVRIVDDNTPELEERLNIRLALNNSYRLGARSQASLVVQDNDTPRINLAGPDLVWESGGTVNVTASLSRPSPLPVEADVRFSSNTGSGLATFRQVNGDFFSSVTRIRFEPGQQVVPIPIRLTNDSTIEKNEWFTVYLENPVNGLLGRRDTFSVTIQDDDIGITLPSVVHLSESTRTHFFSLQLSSAPQRQVTVPFRITGTARSGADYVLKSSSTVVIQPGQWSAGIEFEIVDDNIAEDYEEIRLEVLDPLNAKIVGRRMSTIYINDNEGTPIITFAPLGYVNGQPRYAFSVLEENLRQEVKIQLSHPSSRDVHVRVLRGLNATANVDYRLVGSNPGTENVFTIPAGSVETSFFVEVLSDNLREGSERLELQLTRPTNARLSNAPVTIRGTILDNDSPQGSGLGLWQGTYAFARDQLTFNPNYAGLVTGSLALMTDAEVLDLFYQVSTLGVAQAQTVETIPAYDPTLILSGALAMGANPFAGPIQGAALFFDTNRNGIRDFFDRNLNGLQDADESHELAGISTADGSTVISTDNPFALDSNSDGVVNSADGRWVSSGGIDTTTGLPRRTIFTAPFGQYALTPMSTLAEELTRRFGFTGTVAMSRVFSAFEVDEFDFSANNVLFSIVSGDARAASVYIPHVQLDTTILLLGELFSAATNESSSVATFGSVVNASIASNVSQPESTLDLASTSTIVSLIQQLAFETGTTLSESLVNTIADVVAAGNSLLSSYQLSNFQNGQAFAEHIMKTKKVLQGELSTALRDVARGVLSEETFLNQFTGSALSARVATATINGVLPAAVVVSNAIVREGSNGGRQLEFILAASEGRTAPITIEYTTIDDSATVADGDYVATSGTLTWQPTDPQTKRVFVTIPGDTKFESDERVQFVITSVTNASVRRGEGYGYIINDDSYSVQTSLEQATNELQLTIDDENGSLTQNDEPLFEGAFIDPMVLNLNGQAIQNDRLTLDFSADVYRADTIQFQGGAGASDSLTITGGIFPTVEYTISSPDSSRLRLIPESVLNRSLVESLGVESVAVNAAQIGTLVLRVPATITALRIEDADASTTGRMRVVSPTNAFAPLEFTNPTTKILVLQDSLVGTELTIGTLDSAFTPGAAGIEEARTGIYLSHNSINENSAGGSIIGSVTSRELGFDGGTFAVAFVSGGTSDNASFQLTPSRDLATGANTILDFENRTNYTIRLQATSSTTSESIEVTATVQVNNLPELAAPVQIGHIANSDQRSIVRNVVVSFDSQVTIDSGAFAVEQRNLVNGAPVYTAVTTAFTQPVQQADGRWPVTLSFSGSLTTSAGNLVDGDYRLTIDASKVRHSGVALDGNRDGTAGGNFVLGESATDRFFALFGDTNGDGLVGIAEFGQFRSAFGKTSADAGYNALFDFENDGVVGISDFGQFRSRFGKSRRPFN